METAHSAAWQRLARRYIWWQAPEEALRAPHRLIAQVMDLGTLGDIASLRQLAGDGAMRQALAEAAAGEFSDRSWHFWHQMLGDGELVAVPPLPARLPV
jgi:hypothetical protein